MQLERNKSDKKDAVWICRYAIDQKPALWEMPHTAYFESKQLYNTIRHYSDQTKALQQSVTQPGYLATTKQGDYKIA